MLQASHDYLCCVQTTTVNTLPNLQILKPLLRMGNAHWRLSADHVPRYFSMGMLTLLTPSSRFALP